VASLEGKRVLVVGASAGVGRGIAIASVQRGGTVVLSARRKANLDDAIAEAGGGIAITADVCKDGDCARLVAEAVKTMGGLDFLVYCTGAAPLQRIKDTTPEEWAFTWNTNVVGFNEVMRAALPHLRPESLVLVLSSESAHVVYPGLVAYAASKAALESLIIGWRNEHPGLRICCIPIGATQPTEFAASHDMALLTELIPAWVRQGAMRAEIMETSVASAAIVDMLAPLLDQPTVGVENMMVRTPSGFAGSASSFVDYATDHAQMNAG
jgi:NAD(P)-dependent dehydrogenase (short-subunit alcohol dehydrogenase family)